MIKRFIGKYIRGNPKLMKYVLSIFIRLHNYSYKKITEYASMLNGGINPKHEITHYHDYFVTRVSSNDTVLDIGCGVGLLASSVAKKASKVTGIDISSGNIQSANQRHNHENLVFICGDANTYNFEGTFDKLILSNVLEHIEDRISLLKKLSKLGPVLLLRVPMITRDWMAVYKKENGYPYKLDDTHFTEYRLEDVQSEAKAAGWIIESYQVNWGEFWGVLRREN